MKTRSIAVVLACFLLLPAVAATAQQNPPPQDKVDKAIDDGCKYLMQNMDNYLKDYDWAGEGKQTDAVLVAYTLIKGVGKENKRKLEKNPAFLRCIGFLWNHPIEHTYFASVLAIGLEQLDPEKFFGRIGQCAQFLVDSQCKNGQWSYGEKIPMPVSSGKRPKSRKTFVTKPVIRRFPGKKQTGDNSNTQYAILGLRSCQVDGWEIPKETWEEALKWWKSQQRDDGGWNYSSGGKSDEGSYLGMAEGGLGSVVICMHFLGQDWRTDESVKKVKNYLAKNLSMEKNFVPREAKESWQYYHLYALERGANLSMNHKFGDHNWYAEGATYLLEKQAKNGSWKAPGGWGNETWDTCFAVLFLARATAPVITGAAGSGKKEEGKDKE